MNFLDFFYEQVELKRKDVEERGSIKQDKKKISPVKHIEPTGKPVNRIKIFKRYGTKPKDISTQPAGMLGP